MLKGKTNTTRRWAVAGGAAVLAGVLGVGPVAMASTTAQAKAPARSSVVCRSANGLAVTGSDAKTICVGLKLYKGKTITFVAADKPGGGFDQFARSFAPYLSKYLGASVNVLNVPAGNTVAGQNYVAASNTSSPGYTVGWLNVGPDVEDLVLHIPGIQFNPQGEVFLGATAPDLTVTAAWKSSACSAWDNGLGGLLAHNSASNPVTEPIQTTGSTTFNQLMLDGVFGIHYRALNGYASSAQLIQGWVRGDGCVVTEPVSVIGSYIQGGKAVALAVNQPLQRTNAFYNTFVHVPTYAQAERTFARYIKGKTQTVAAQVLLVAGNTSRVLFVPPKTPQTLQAAMRQAFLWATSNSILKIQLEDIGASNGYVTGVVAKSGYIAYLDGTKKVTEYLAAIA